MHQPRREPNSPMPWRGPAEVAAVEAALFESRQRQRAQSVPTGGPMTDTNPSVARLRHIGNGMLREADELRKVGTDFLRWADEHETDQQSAGPQHSAELPAERGAERGLPILNAAERAIANGTAAVPQTPPGP